MSFQAIAFFFFVSYLLPESTCFRWGQSWHDTAAGKRETSALFFLQPVYRSAPRHSTAWPTARCEREKSRWSFSSKKRAIDFGLSECNLLVNKKSDYQYFPYCWRFSKDIFKNVSMGRGYVWVSVGGASVWPLTFPCLKFLKVSSSSNEKRFEYVSSIRRPLVCVRVCLWFDVHQQKCKWKKVDAH